MLGTDNITIIKQSNVTDCHYNKDDLFTYLLTTTYNDLLRRNKRASN